MTEQTPDRDTFGRLAETLAPEQKQLLMEYDAEMNAHWGHETQALADELSRHLPAFAVAIEIVYQHIIDQRPAVRGICCTSEAASPRCV